jgi:hypothetical protein
LDLTLDARTRPRTCRCPRGGGAPSAWRPFSLTWAARSQRFSPTCSLRLVDKVSTQIPYSHAHRFDGHWPLHAQRRATQWCPQPSWLAIGSGIAGRQKENWCKVKKKHNHISLQCEALGLWFIVLLRHAATLIYRDCYGDLTTSSINVMSRCGDWRVSVMSAEVLRRCAPPGLNQPGVDEHGRGDDAERAREVTPTLLQGVPRDPSRGSTSPLGWLLQGVP